MKIIYTSGNILESHAEALVNTVNCEGYMGKGIAYQFKLKYPKNNEDYIRACKSGKLTVGNVHYFQEGDKIIINFPTKNKWRANSEMEYIDAGLNSLIRLIDTLQVHSIAVPPLGCGNGGLMWHEVKMLIERKFAAYIGEVSVYVYEPSKNYSASPTIEPKLGVSALILMRFKQKLGRFNSFRLQKAAFFMNLFYGEHYFRFARYKYGPYDNSIAIVSRSIREFQQYHGVRDVYDAYDILFNKIVSEKTLSQLSDLTEYVDMSCAFVDSIKTDHELECLATIAFIVQEHGSLSDYDILHDFMSWSDDKAARFTTDEILQGIHKLYESGILERDIVGFRMSERNEFHG